MTAGRRHRRREAGFTLIETLIALSLTAVIFSLLFGGVRFGTRIWESTDERVAAAGTHHALHRVLRNIAQATVPAIWGRDDEAAFVFEGAPGRLRLVADGGVGSDVPGPVLYQFSVDSTPDGDMLVLTRAPYYRGDDPPEDPPAGDDDIVTLAGPARSIGFSYFGSPGSAIDTDDAAWFDRWEAEDNMPRLIALRIVDDTGEPWPGLVVSLPVDMDGGCIAGDTSGLRMCRLQEDG